MTDDWRQRLLDAIEHSPLSDRQICKRAGVGSSFVSDLKNAGKDPKAASVVKVVSALDVSLSYVFAGIDISPETEEVVRIWTRLPKEMRDHLLALARGLADDEPSPKETAVDQDSSAP